MRRQHGLDSIEGVLADERLEVPTLAAHPVLGHVHDARVELMAEQHPDRLRAERLAAPATQTPRRHLLQQLLLREPPGGVLLEGPSHERRAFRVGHQALAQGAH